MEHYCGPDYFPKWLKKFLGNKGKFEIACQIHDEMYEQRKGRKKSDLIFLDDMLEKCENKKDKCIAYFLYWLVRIFGWTRYGRK